MKDWIAPSSALYAADEADHILRDADKNKVRVFFFLQPSCEQGYSYSGSFPVSTLSLFVCCTLQLQIKD